MRIGFDQGIELLGCDQRCRVGNEHRHEGEAEVERATEDRRADGDFRASRRGHALEDILLRHRAEHHRDPGAKEGQPFGGAAGRKEIELAGCRCLTDDHLDAARHSRNQVADVEHAAHHHAHLHEVEDGHRQHAAKAGIGQHDQRPEDHACLGRDGAGGDDVEDQPQRLDLRRNPAEVRGDDAHRGEHLDGPVVAHAEEIAEGQDIEPIQSGAVEDAGNDQAQAGAERVGDDTTQAVLDEGCRHPENGLGAEPGGEHGCRDYRQRQAAAGHREVLGVVYARCRVEADGDRNEQVDDDEPDQHPGTPGASSRIFGFFGRPVRLWPPEGGTAAAGRIAPFRN